MVLVATVRGNKGAKVEPKRKGGSWEKAGNDGKGNFLSSVKLNGSKSLKVRSRLDKGKIALPWTRVAKLLH